MKGKKTTVALAFLIVILLGVIGFKYSQMSGQSPIQASHKNSQVKNAAQSKSQSKEKADDNSEKPKENKNLEKKEITITCWGDYMNHITQIRQAKATNYDFTDSFAVIKDIVGKSDLSVVNLETTIAKDESDMSGYPEFATHENVIKALKDTGFDVVSTANNHAYDRRLKGIDRTIDTIEKYGLKRTGTFKENESTNPLIVDVKGIKVGFFSYSQMLNGYEKLMLNSGRDTAVNLIDMDKIKKDVDYLKKNHADVIMCYMHWGEEYSDYPNSYQKNTFKKLADMGVDLVIGSHPHTIQKSDVIENNGKKSYCVYSLGNLVSDQRESYGQSYGVEIGVYSDIKIEKIGDKTTVKSFENKPYYVDKYTDSVTTRYVVVPVKQVLNSEINYPRKDKIISKLNRANQHYEKIFNKE
ncbi:bacterial capsule synthesis protein [Finegoldia magna SY403409CC001050417]|uniref:CapA family protein n=1 Tax=Finegoldia magna TaxID=1260 RepID=A0A7D4JCI8_FINMA|nr:CapA family protein [Finegoldia magna]EGS35082.1 bacterial capsule synthesis protein [Finegoldia magna SY403409CC001050417]QKH78939.1 CapA family protein [Finegoldia magna]